MFMFRSEAVQDRSSAVEMAIFLIGYPRISFTRSAGPVPKISDEIQPACRRSRDSALMARHWPGLSRCCPDRYTVIGDGATYQRLGAMSPPRPSAAFAISLRLEPRYYLPLS
jgi:hypothetical protein